MTEPKQSFTEEVEKEAEKATKNIFEVKPKYAFFSKADYELGYKDGAEKALSILSTKSEGREFWIVDSITGYYVGDKPYPSVYEKDKQCHVIEYSALIAERAKNALLISNSSDLVQEYARETTALESENAALKAQLKFKHEQVMSLADLENTLRAQVVRARELYELATRELVKRDADDTDEHEGQEAAVDSWMADYDLELQKKGQGDE